MADPFSITASVAGLISLGVQITGGVTQYLDAVREREDDIASAKTQVQRMQELLKVVEDVAAKIKPSHNATAAFLNAAASVEPELKALKEFILRIDAMDRPPPSHKILEKAYIQAKKLKYPFNVKQWRNCRLN